jgi:hypothetical protein
MSDNGQIYYQTDRRTSIRNFVLSEMMRGAGWAASVLIGIVLLLWAIYGIGLLLPAESKNAPPPMPFSQIQIVAPAAQV